MTCRSTLLTLLAAVALPVPSPQQPPRRPAAPDTEIYLASLNMTGDRIDVGTPTNISQSPGYDNQPSFTRDAAAILFTSARGGTQTDIYRYDLASKRVTQVTNTPESEYSPTETPDGGLSVVRVEGDGTQRLWRFTAEGREPRVLLESLKPVGYHAWADEHTLALYILGQSGTTQPSTLQVADIRTGAVRQLATDIGRSLLPIPGRHTISFVQREGAGEKVSLFIKELDPASASIRLLTPAVDGTGEADCAWAPDGTLLMARGDRLYAWHPSGTPGRSVSVEGSSPSGWREVAAFERLGLRNVTRLAISPKGDWIAVVAAPN